jgi:integrase
MARKPTGEVRVRAGIFEARVTLQGKARKSFPLVHCKTEPVARERGAVLAELAGRMRTAGLLETPQAIRLLEMVAEAKPGALTPYLEAADMLIGGDTVAAHPKARPTTWGDIADAWVSGELHERHPDHVKLVSAPRANESRVKMLKQSIGEISVVSFTLEHAEHAMRQLPKDLTPGTRRHYAQAMRRVLSFSVYPLKLIQQNPIPAGFMPKQKGGKAHQWLYPREDAALIVCGEIPLHWRLFWGFLYREGLRASEAFNLRVRDLDLEAGIITLDKNKTADPRAWALSADVGEALRLWLAARGNPGGSAYVFADAFGRGLGGDHMADLFREHLTLAGLHRARPELFAKTDARSPIRAHDQRAAFVTLNLAAGKSESWISDRTGHQSSAMIHRYKRQARMASELGMGAPISLVQALPELTLLPPGHCPQADSSHFAESQTSQKELSHCNQNENLGFLIHRSRVRISVDPL